MTTLRIFLTAVVLAVATVSCTESERSDEGTGEHSNTSAPSLDGLWELDDPTQGPAGSWPWELRPYLYLGDDGYASVRASGLSAAPVPWKLLDGTKLRVILRGGGETEIATITETPAGIAVHWSGGDSNSYSFLGKFDSKKDAHARIREINPPPPVDPDMPLGFWGLPSKHSRVEHGYWTQVSPSQSPDGSIIQELHFHEGGFTVTIHPFCRYKDYWGSYQYSEETGKLRFGIEGGNKIPQKFGSVRGGNLKFVDEDRIIISDFHLHMEPQGSSSYTFARNRG